MIISMKTRLIDIAKKAKVSSSTVSLVLQGKPGVNKDTARKIQQIAYESGYISQQKQQKVKIKELTFAKIIKHGSILNAEHFLFVNDYIDGIISEAKKKGYGVIIDTFDLRENSLQQVLTKIKGYSSAGIIILGTELNTDDLKQLEVLTVPFVILDTYYDFLPHSFFDMNNSDSLYKIVEYLSRLGHRRIGLCYSDCESENYLRRKICFKDCLEKFGLSILPKDSYCTKKDIGNENHEIMKMLSANRNDLPTAIFCVSDALALNVMKVCHELNIDIPSELSLIGFDNLEVDALTQPPLTSVEVPKRRIAQEATICLIDEIENIEPSLSKKVLLSGTIIIRDSVAAPKKNINCKITHKK
jgi:LacI family transcriptional regulator